MRVTTASSRARARLAAVVGDRAAVFESVPRLPMPGAVRGHIEVARLSWSPEVVWLVVCGAAAGLVAVAVGTGAIAVGAVLLATGAVSLWFALDLLGQRASRRAAAALPDVVGSVAEILRAGASLRQAFAESSARAGVAVRPHLAPVVERIERGVPLTDAFDEWARRDPLPGVVLAAAALALAAEVGGAAAVSLEGVAATLRERLALDREVRALASQARASAAVMALAPLAFASLATSVDPTTEGFLFSTPAGAACLAGGLTLDLAGAWWMHRLTAGSP